MLVREAEKNFTDEQRASSRHIVKDVGQFLNGRRLSTQGITEE
jgi:hypothetical protein